MIRHPQTIKILFDAGPLVNGNRTGVGKTTQGLIEALAQEYPNNIELVGHYFDFLGRKHAQNLPTAPNIRYRRTVLIPGKVYNMLRRLGVWIPFELLVKEKGDFHIFPGFIGWPSLFGAPSAPFVHDITYIDFPQYVNGPAQFDLKTIMPRTIKRSSFIITNSQSSKDGLQKVYDLSHIPVLVEHIPPVGTVTISTQDAQNRRKRLGISGKYLLFFGTLEPRKNLVGLIDAYKLLTPQLRSTYSLVIGGGKGWKDAKILDSISQLQQSGAYVIQTGYVSDEDRAALFMGASVYLMPSHYEGFGMQLLEGMVYQTPMLVTDIPVLREVGQGSAVYCGTTPPDIAQALTVLLQDTAIQNKLRTAGKKRLQDFKWEVVARDIYQAIRRATT